MDAPQIVSTDVPTEQSAKQNELPTTNDAFHVRTAAEKRKEKRERDAVKKERKGVNY